MHTLSDFYKPPPLDDARCMRAEFFKANPRAQYASVACSCPRCSPWCEMCQPGGPLDDWADYCRRTGAHEWHRFGIEMRHAP